MSTNPVLERFLQLIGEDIDVAQSLPLDSIDLFSFMRMSKKELWQLIEDSDINATINKLNALYYWVAYKELRTGTGEELKFLQEKFNDTILNWFIEFPTGKLIALQNKVMAEQFHQQTQYTNLQVLRGSRCNVRCQMCFIHELDKDVAISVDSLRYLQHVQKVNYSMSGLFKSMLHGKVAYGLREVLFSSYGDPTSNSPALLPQEVALAKELGFSQITMLTNGVALSYRMLEQLFESGLTNLTLSIHTESSEKHDEIVKPYKANTHEHLLDLVKQANENGLVERGLILRFNVAYSKMLLEDESIQTMIAFANRVGVQQITFIEMIVANAWAESQYVGMPESIPGYHETGQHHWGMQFFAPNNGKGAAVALCHFGNENTDATFAQQTKNLQLVLAPDDEGHEGPFLKAGDMYGFEGTLKLHRI